MHRTLVLALAGLAITMPVFAQTQAKPDGLWRGALGAGVTASSGNTESITYAINGDAIKQTSYDKMSGFLQAVYGRREAAGATERTSDLLRTGGLYNRDINDRTFGFGSLDLERNRLIDLNLRSVIAGGIGYHVIKREGLTFDVSTGPAYNREQYSTETRDAIEWLLAEESSQTLTPMISFRQKLALYPSLKDSGEYRFVFDAGLVFKINNRWNATMTLNNRYQSNPRPGVKNNDLLFVTGLQYVFNP